MVPFGRRRQAWYLLDAVEQAAAHPRSYFIPSVDEREGLRPGDLAKLSFLLHDDTDEDYAGERMWVEVTDVAPGGYVGRLANEPVAIPDLAYGDRVEFEPRHVIQLPADAPDPWEGQVAFATERLFDDDDRGLGVLVHDPEDAGQPAPYDRVLSGWSFLVGDETQDELDDPDRVRLPSLPWLLERHPEARALLEGHDGTAGTWVRQGEVWVRE